MNEIEAQREAESKKRRETEERVAEMGKKKQWEPGKIKLLSQLKKESKEDSSCIVCGDNRENVLHNHHIKCNNDLTVKLCANCHDIVRRGELKDLKEMEKYYGNFK